jgi:hypothetical protein
MTWRILQIELDMLGEWVFENEIINPAKGEVFCFTKALVTESLNYSLEDIVILKANIVHIGESLYAAI